MHTMQPKDNITSIFHHIVSKYAQQLTPDITEMLHSNFDAGEAKIAFENLIDNLYEVDVEVDTETGKQLYEIAKALGMTDLAPAKGKYWQ
jgi:hypothetical protein